MLNFEKISNAIIKEAKENGLEVSDWYKRYGITEHRDIKGIFEKPVYSGMIPDGIYFEKQEGINRIEIIVNGNCYKAFFYWGTHVKFYKSKLFIDGMYYCLNEKDGVEIKEQTFKNAIKRFFKRNNLIIDCSATV